MNKYDGMNGDELRNEVRRQYDESHTYCEGCDTEVLRSGIAPDCPECKATFCIECLAIETCCDQRNWMKCNHCGFVDDIDVVRMKSGAIVKLCSKCKDKANLAGKLADEDSRSYRECEACKRMEDCEEIPLHGYSQWLCETCYHRSQECH